MMRFLHRAGRHRHAAWIGMALCGIALAVLPFAVEAALSRTWVRIIDFALLYTMLALGLNIVVGFAGLLDLGYIAFYAVGAYAYALLASPHFGVHLPFWVLIPLGAALAAFFGVILGAPTLRLRGDYLAIVTLGFGEIVRIQIVQKNANDLTEAQRDDCEVIAPQPQRRRPEYHTEECRQARA